MTNRTIIKVLWSVHPEQVTEEYKSILINNVIGDMSYKIPMEECKKLAGRDINWILTSNRLQKVKNNIVKSISEQIKYPFICYTFGENNHKFLTDIGVNSVLLNKDPNPFHMYRHKIEAWRMAMKDFDEIVFLDWDSKPIKPIDETFWTILNSKDIIQASLGTYRSHKIKYRPNHVDNKYTPSGAFVYMKDKSLPDRILKEWIGLGNLWSEEPSLAKITDLLMGQWNIKEYEKRFEPSVFSKERHNVFKKDGNLIYFTNRCHPWRY